MKNKLAIIMVNYKTYQFTFKCVDSIFNTCKEDYHIYIVDNNSPNESLEKLQDKYGSNEKITIVNSMRNRGYSDGLNQGYSIAKRQDDYAVYLFINNDLLFYEDTFSNLMTAFVKYPDIGVVGGQILNDKENPIVSYKPRLTYKYQLQTTKPFSWLFKTNIQTKVEHPMLLDGMVAGCFFAINNTMMEALKMFDDNVFIYYEEDILSIRIHEMGKQALLDPSIRVLHFGSQTIPKNAFTYFNRYKSVLYTISNYCKCSKTQLRLLYLIYAGNLWVKSIKDKEFKKAKADLKAYYKKLKEEL